MIPRHDRSIGSIQFSDVAFRWSSVTEFGPSFNCTG
jgi:hypothetical protein